MLTRHQLPIPVFDDLAMGYGDAQAINELRRAQLSRHLLMLRAVMDAAGGAGLHGDDTALVSGYRLLADVQRHAPRTAAAVLLHPQVGAWAAACLRRLRGVTTGAVPTHLEVGHLAAVAAAAAVRARLAFEIDVPVRDGTVMLPTLGLAMLPASASSGTATVRAGHAGVEVIAAGARIVVPGDGDVDTAGWRALRRLRASAGSHRIEVFLDDFDPYRSAGDPSAAWMLDDEDVERWQERLDQAWAVLGHHHPRHAAAIAAGVASLVPLTRGRSDEGVSASSTADAFGAIASVLPGDGSALASNLVHEFQHAKLGAILHLFQLYDARDGDWYYAPWRSDPRPLGALLQGAYAFMGVAGFLQVHRAVAAGTLAALANFEFARWRTASREAVKALQASGRLTVIGQRFVSGMQATVRTFAHEPVPAEPLRLAKDAAADHRSDWRLRNLRPDPDAVERLATTWLRGSARPRPERLSEEIVPGTGSAEASGRLRLMRLRLRDPSRFQRLAEGMGDPVSGGGPAAADIAVVLGDDVAAARSYREQIAADPARPGPWAGLALTQRGARPAAHALRSHPEVVAAVHRQLREVHGVTAEPLRLAAWLAPLRPSA